MDKVVNGTKEYKNDIIYFLIVVSNSNLNKKKKFIKKRSSLSKNISNYVQN